MGGWTVVAAGAVVAQDVLAMTVVGGVPSRRGGALTTLDAMYHFFMLQNMYAVGTSYWAMAYGQMPGDVRKDEEGLETMRNLGRNMAYLLKALEERRDV